MALDEYVPVAEINIKIEDIKKARRDKNRDTTLINKIRRDSFSKFLTFLNQSANPGFRGEQLVSWR
jgi:hypothetical protein